MTTKQEQVDLFKYPENISTLKEGDELTIGDLHGNSIKFLFFLIKQGVLTLNHGEQDYNELVHIYNDTKKTEDEISINLKTLQLETSDINNIANILKKDTSQIDINTIFEDMSISVEESDKITTILVNRQIKNNLKQDFNINDLIQIFNNYINNPPTKEELNELKEIANNQPTKNKLAKNINKIIDTILNSKEEELNNNIANTTSSLIKHKNNQDTKQAQININNFKEILNTATFTKNANTTKIRLIGDELSDRGNNDYFTLLILDKLNKNTTTAPKTEIIFSNHSADFVKFYETGLKTNFAPDILAAQTTSLFGLIDLMDKKIVTKEELEKIINDSYKPNLKLISYSIDESTSPNTFNLYSHAPIDLKNIQELATKFKVQYNNSSLEMLAKTIDAINTKFTTLVQQNNVTDTMKNDSNLVIYNAIWNRNTKDLKRNYSPSTKYQIHYIHGHHGNGEVPEQDEKSVTNLDNSLGKSYRPDYQNNEGVYTIDITNLPPPIPEEIFEPKEDISTNIQEDIHDFAEDINILHDAINNENIQKITEILNTQDILQYIHFENTNQKTALQLAVEKQNSTMVDLILNKMKTNGITQDMEQDILNALSKNPIKKDDGTTKQINTLLNKAITKPQQNNAYKPMLFSSKVQHAIKRTLKETQHPKKPPSH